MTTKVVMIGPPHSGKTTLANYLADATDSTSGEYHPTSGVRILEFSCNLPDSKAVDVLVLFFLFLNKIESMNKRCT